MSEKTKARRVNFTKEALERATCEKGRAYLYDAKVRHLCLMVTETGAKSFYVYRRLGPGKVRRIRLGSYETMTIPQARAKAEIINGQIAEGVDPTEARKAQRQSYTLGDLWLAYLADAKTHKRTWYQDQSAYSRHLAGWANRRLDSFERTELVEWHQRLAREIAESGRVKTRLERLDLGDAKAMKEARERAGRTMANRVLGQLVSMFRRAPELLPGYGGGNPAAGIRRFKEVKRERYLLPHEMEKFREAVKLEPNPDIRDFVTLSLLCGTRRANLQALRWDQLRLDAATWEIPGSEFKTGRSHAVHLPPRAVEILRRRQRDQAEAGLVTPWVFPSRGASGHIVEPRFGFLRILKDAGLKDVRLHDLRRTLASWMTTGGASLPIVGKLLGHTNPQSTAVYARLQLEPVRPVVNAATEAMFPADSTDPTATGSGGGAGQARKRRPYKARRGGRRVRASGRGVAHTKRN